MSNDELIPRLRNDGTLPEDEYVRGLDLRYLVDVADALERADFDPQPTMWAACGTCDATYTLVRRYSLGKQKWSWVWERVCKHKSEPVLMTAKGRAS